MCVRVHLQCNQDSTQVMWREILVVLFFNFSLIFNPTWKKNSKTDKMTFMSANSKPLWFQKAFPAFKESGVSCCFSAVLDVRFFLKIREWVSWRWVAHTSDLCLHTSRRQLGPSVSPFSFQPIWLGFSTLLVPWGSQMDCCEGRWVWPAGGLGGGGWSVGW